MLNYWLNFGVLIFFQFTFFIVQAYYIKKLSDVPYLLGLGVPTGIVMGLIYDLTLVKFFGLNSYYLGFGLFLIINGALSYGLFVANTLLMQRVKFLFFLPWIISLVTVCESVNFFFPVWKWEFVLPNFYFFIVLIVGYLEGAIFVAVISHYVLKKQFLFIDNLFNK